VVEIEPDALAVTTRFRATHTLVGDIEEICRDLTSRVETLEVKVEKKRSIQQSMKLDERAMIEKFGYMMHNNPGVVELAGPKKQPSLKRVVSDGIATMVKDSNALWRAIHNGEVSTVRVMCFINFFYSSCLQLPTNAHGFLLSCSGAKFKTTANACESFTMTVVKATRSTVTLECS
jgi:hypothetical protein